MDLGRWDLVEDVVECKIIKRFGHPLGQRRLLIKFQQLATSLRLGEDFEPGHSIVVIAIIGYLFIDLLQTIFKILKLDLRELLQKI